MLGTSLGFTGGSFTKRLSVLWPGTATTMRSLRRSWRSRSCLRASAMRAARSASGCERILACSTYSWARASILSPTWRTRSAFNAHCPMSIAHTGRGDGMVPPCRVLTTATASRGRYGGVRRRTQRTQKAAVPASRLSIRGDTRRAGRSPLGTHAPRCDRSVGEYREVAGLEPLPRALLLGGRPHRQTPSASRPIVHFPS